MKTNQHEAAKGVLCFIAKTTLKNHSKKAQLENKITLDLGRTF